MLDHLEALRILAQEGTITEAATRLRLTQSAVSKRIAALELATGLTLIEPVGRRVQLTPAGKRLLQRTVPLMASLKAALVEEALPESSELTMAVSESILASWGAGVLAAVQAAIPGLTLKLNTHRSLEALDHVRSGDYVVALLAGLSEVAPDLHAEPLLEEPMVIVPSRLDPSPLLHATRIEALTIERHSATWHFLEARIRRLERVSGRTLHITSTLQSFHCLVPMAMAGFGHALVPRAVAEMFRIRPEQLFALPAPGLQRAVSLIGRPSVFGLPLVSRVLEALRQAVQAEGALGHVDSSACAVRPPVG